MGVGCSALGGAMGLDLTLGDGHPLLGPVSSGVGRGTHFPLAHLTTRSGRYGLAYVGLPGMALASRAWPEIRDAGTGIHFVLNFFGVLTHACALLALCPRHGRRWRHGCLWAPVEP